VPGEVPTLAEAVDDTGLSQLQRTLLNNPDANAPITSRLRANTNARTGALRDMTGNDGLRDLMKADRAAATEPLYEQAFAQGMNETPWIKGQITQLSQRDAFGARWTRPRGSPATKGSS
jgi:hypothetical protein